MNLTVILLIILISLLSSFIQGFTGFGFSIAAMTLMPLIMPFRLATAVIAASSMFMVLWIAFKLREFINYKLILYPFMSSTLTSFIGIFTLESVADTVVRRILGLVFIMTSLFMIFFNNKVRFSKKPVNGLLAGAASGFLSGLFNLGGPPMAVYFLAVTENKMEYNSTLQCYFALNGFIVLILHIFMGDFNAQITIYSLLSLAGVVVGTLSGYILFRKISMNVIRKSIYSFMMIFGIYLLISG